MAATSAQLRLPNRIALDEEGDLFIADQGNHRVRKVAAKTGLMSTVAGNGATEYIGDGVGATSLSIARPWDLAFSRSGDLYVTDDADGTVMRIEAKSGRMKTISRLKNPRGLTVDISGNIYVAQ